MNGRDLLLHITCTGCHFDVISCATATHNPDAFEVDTKCGACGMIIGGLVFRDKLGAFDISRVVFTPVKAKSVVISQTYSSPVKKICTQCLCPNEVCTDPFTCCNCGKLNKSCDEVKKSKVSHNCPACGCVGGNALCLTCSGPKLATAIKLQCLKCLLWNEVISENFVCFGCGAANNTSKKPEEINHPAYYRPGVYEAINVIEAWKLGFCLGNTVKYISRAGQKPENGLTPRQQFIKDLKKSAWYLKRELDRAEQEEKEGR